MNIKAYTHTHMINEAKIQDSFDGILCILFQLTVQQYTYIETIVE